MKQLVEFRLQDGSTVLMEVEGNQNPTIERVALPSGEMLIKAQQTFDQALDQIKPAVSTIIDKLNSLNTPASEVEVKCGLKLTADAGAIFTTVGGEVNFEITLKWTKE